MGDAAYEAEYVEPPVEEEKGDPINVVSRKNQINSNILIGIFFLRSFERRIVLLPS